MTVNDGTQAGVYVELAGVQVWYDVQGEGEPVVLLHGGFSDSRDFTTNLAGLGDAFRVFRFDRRGHGRTGDVPGPISHQVMAEDAVRFVEAVVGGTVRLVGYSDGAVVSLMVAMARPDLVSRLVLVSGAARPEGWLLTPDPEGAMPDVVVDAYAKVSPDGRAHFPEFAAKVLAPAGGPPTYADLDLAGLGSRTLVMTADDDLIRLEHSLALYRALPQAELAIMPGTSHTLLQEKPALCTAVVRDFLANDPTATYIPIRRATHGAGADHVTAGRGTPSVY